MPPIASIGKRLRYAWHVLRGRPLMYRQRILVTENRVDIAPVNLTENNIVGDCAFVLEGGPEGLTFNGKDWSETSLEAHQREDAW